MKLQPVQWRYLFGYVTQDRMKSVETFLELGALAEACGAEVVNSIGASQSLIVRLTAREWLKYGCCRVLRQNLICDELAGSQLHVKRRDRTIIELI